MDDALDVLEAFFDVFDLGFVPPVDLGWEIDNQPAFYADQASAWLYRFFVTRVLVLDVIEWELVSELECKTGAHDSDAIDWVYQCVRLVFQDVSGDKVDVAHRLIFPIAFLIGPPHGLHFLQCHWA